MQQAANSTSKTDKPYLSVAIITFNEERIIEKTLSAIHNWVDEIVVVDSYSTDKTLNIMEMFNVVIYQNKWEGYYKQKNYALSKCTGEWIMVLDADEVIGNELRDEIQKVIKEPGIYNGFKIKRKFYIGGKWVKHGGYYPDYQLRLFKSNINAIFKPREVHESISLTGPVGYLSNPLDHFAYENAGEYSRALKKYARLASKEIKNKLFYLPYLRAFWSLIYRYLFRLGFLDGELGLKLALAYSTYVYSKYKFASATKHKEQG